MAATIREFVDTRGIKALFHFTRAENLASILQQGLVTRDVVGDGGVCNDPYRIDGTNAVCVSIGFPNYKMLWGLRQDNPDTEWVIVVLHARALWEMQCAFCQANAASAQVTAIPLPQRMTLGALQIMYADFGGKQRAALNIPDHFPTNPQAEVLALDGIPREYVGGVLVRTNAMKVHVETAFPGTPVKLAPNYFRYRQDYEHWKAGAA